MRRAGFPFKYSGGFHPSPRISFGPALKVGVAGLKEYMDVELILPFDISEGLMNLNRTLPEGILADKMDILIGREKTLNSFIIKYIYEVKHNNELDVDRYLEKKAVRIIKNSKHINIKEVVEELIKIDSQTVHLTIIDRGEIKLRLDEVIPEIFNVPLEELDITRIAMYGWDGQWTELMDEEKRWAVKS